MVLTDRAAMTVASEVAWEQGRYAIDHVLVEGNGTAVATDARHLVVVEGPRGKGAKHDAFPELVPPSLALKASKPLSKLARSRSGAATEVEINGKIRFRAKDGINIEEYTYPHADGRYPEWVEMMPSDEGRLIGTFNANMLAGMLEQTAKAIRAMRGDAGEAVRVTLRSHRPTEEGRDDTAALSICAEHEGRRAVGLIMPIRSKVAPPKITGGWTSHVGRLKKRGDA